MAKVYQAYPEYKDSGVEWLGVIPKDWSVTRIKFFSELNPSKNKLRNLPVDMEVTFLPMEAIGEQGELDTSRTKLLEEVISGYTYLEEGDVCIAKITPCFENGKGAVLKQLSNKIGFATTEVIPLRCNSPEDRKFLYYLLTSSPFNKQAEGSMYGAGGQKRVSDNFVANYHFALPKPIERPKIAHFLDHETAKIDALIEKQQQLIALLKEKRQAVISHAVTKGLNPNVKMKDSGVEWLGDVPEHWKVGKLGYYAKISNGATPNRENKAFWENGNIPWLNSSKINDVFVTQAEQFITKDALLKTSVQPVKENDILMAITGEGQTRGRVAICKISATINQHLAAISITDKLIDHEFLFLWLRSQYERLRFESDGGGATKAAITCGEIGAFPVVIPTSSEQKEIVKYIFKKNDHFDGLEEKAQYQIQLLQERRTALISAAVTGKIDLRDWQAA